MTITAKVNYLGQMEDYPVAFSYNREASNLAYDPRAVTLRDIRSLPNASTLEEKGFMLAQVPFVCPSGADPEDHLRTFHAAMLDYLERTTSAAKVVLIGPFVRHADPARALPGKTPAHYVHADYTAKSFMRTARALVADEPEGERFLAGRIAILQTWTAISPPPQDSVLTVLDRRTLVPDDIVEGTVVVGVAEDPRPHPALLFRHNPAHKWYFLSDMTPNDTLVFVGCDSYDLTMPGTPHTAIANPTPGTTHRVSAEMRAFVFWG